MLRITNLAFKVTPGLIVLAISAGSQAGEIRNLGKMKPVSAISIDTSKFVPQINPGKGNIRREKDHYEVRIPQGKPNTLVSGGLNSLSRIGAEPGFVAVGATGYEPPDPDIAVGPNHIINTVNSDIAIFDKTGRKLFQQSFSTFFASIGIESSNFDPRVVYDQVSQRWMVCHLGLDEKATGGSSSVCLAVSNTSSPLGTWKAFKLDGKLTENGGEYWFDWPHLGFTTDTVAISGNMYKMVDGNNNGCTVITLPKDTLLSGTAAPTKFHSPGSFTKALARTYGSTNGTLYAADAANTSEVQLTAFVRSGSSYSAVERLISVPGWSQQSFVVSGIAGRQFAIYPGRMASIYVRGDRAVAAHTVNTPTGASTRWYDFTLNKWPSTPVAPTLRQSGTIAPPAGSHYTFPNIAIDRAGAVAVAFCRLSNTTTGDTMVSARKEKDPLGTMSAPTVIAVPPSQQYNGFSNRWGDYLDTDLDPKDNLTFWTVGMAAGLDRRWVTMINSFKISADPADYLTLNNLGTTITSGTVASGSFSHLNKADGVEYVVNSAPINGLGQSAGFTTRFKAPAGKFDKGIVNYSVRGVSGCSSIVMIKNQKTGTWEQLESVSLSSVATVRTVNLSDVQLAKYLSSSGNLELSLRGVLPVRSGRMPSPFRYAVDLGIIQLLPVIE